MKIRKKLVIVFALIILVFAAKASIADEESGIPDHLKLAANKEHILGQLVIPGSNETLDVIKYAYRSNSHVSDQPSGQILQAANNEGVSVNQEDVSKRTKNARTFATSNPRVHVTEFISGDPQYYQDPSGEWWIADYATTTKEAFELQTSTSLLEKIIGLFSPEKAYATDSTFYPAAGANSPVDGDIQRDIDPSSEDFATIRAGAGITANVTDDAEHTPRLISTSTTNQYNMLGRVFLLFDTSSIPDGDDITSATLSVVVFEKNDVMSQSVNVYSSSPASNSTLAASDFGNFGTTPFSTAKTIASMVADDSTYHDYALNTSGLSNISKTGVSKFGLALVDDRENGSPSWSSSVQAMAATRFADTTGTSKDPKLVVTHISFVESADDNHIFFSGNATLTADRYMGQQKLCQTVNRVDCEIIVPQNITVQGMSCFMENGTSGNNVTFTLYDNGSPTNVSASSTGTQLGAITSLTVDITANSMITIFADETAGSISGHAACTVRYLNDVN